MSDYVTQKTEHGGRLKPPHRGEPLLFSKSALGYFTSVTQHMGPTVLRPIRRTKHWLSVLLNDTSITAGDSNPHSADQKHQSLNSVLLITARPRHFHCTRMTVVSRSGRSAVYAIKALTKGYTPASPARFTGV